MRRVERVQEAERAHGVTRLGPPPAG